MYDFSGRQLVIVCRWIFCLFVWSFVVVVVVVISSPFCWACLCRFFSLALSQLCSINIRRKQINCNLIKYMVKIYAHFWTMCVCVCCVSHNTLFFVAVYYRALFLITAQNYTSLWHTCHVYELNIQKPRRSLSFSSSSVH